MMRPSPIKRAAPAIEVAAAILPPQPFLVVSEDEEDEVADEEEEVPEGVMLLGAELRVIDPEPAGIATAKIPVVAS